MKNSVDLILEKAIITLTGKDHFEEILFLISEFNKQTNDQDTRYILEEIDDLVRHLPAQTIFNECIDWEYFYKNEATRYMLFLSFLKNKFSKERCEKILNKIQNLSLETPTKEIAANLFVSLNEQVISLDKQL